MEQTKFAVRTTGLHGQNCSVRERVRARVAILDVSCSEISRYCCVAGSNILHQLLSSDLHNIWMSTVNVTSGLAGLDHRLSSALSIFSDLI